MSFKLIIFDLDDTLLDTTGLLIPIARTPAFEARILQPLPLMPWAEENLEYLKKRYDLILLTQGRSEAQAQKVKSLGIGHFFKQQYIANPEEQKPKSYYFSEIVQSLQSPPDSVLSIGNRRSTDIRAAKKYGAKTCLFKYGKHQHEEVQCPEDIPDFEVFSHQELISTCQL